MVAILFEYIQNVDYVIETGSNSNGRYRKWKSGLMEQWLNAIITASITNKYSDALYQGTFGWTLPVPFSTYEFAVCVKAQYDTGASWGTVYAISNTIITIRVFDVTSRASSKKMSVILYARGRWK